MVKDARIYYNIIILCVSKRMNIVPTPTLRKTLLDDPSFQPSAHPSTTATYRHRAVEECEKERLRGEDRESERDRGFPDAYTRTS